MSEASDAGPGNTIYVSASPVAQSAFLASNVLSEICGNKEEFWNPIVQSVMYACKIPSSE